MNALFRSTAHLTDIRSSALFRSNAHLFTKHCVFPVNALSESNAHLHYYTKHYTKALFPVNELLESNEHLYIQSSAFFQ